MTIQQEHLLTLLKNCILNQHNTVAISSFAEIEYLSLDHFCLPFIYQGAINAGLQPPEQWREMLFFRVGQNIHNIKIQQRMIKALEDNQIPCVVLKGTSIAVCYPEPTLRALGDIDILVDEENYQKAIELLLPYHDAKSDVKSHDFHCQLLVDNTAVEIHKGITRDRFRNNHKQVMQGALESIEYKTYEGVTFPVLSTSYQVASMILHTHRHFLSLELNLRLLSDWAVFVQSVTDEQWKTEVVPILQKLKLDLFANGLLATCNRYLGIDCVGKITSDVSPELSKAIIEEFLYAGSSSKRTTVSSGYGNAFAKNKKKYKSSIYTVVITLNNSARGKFPRASRWTILLPILWGCMIIQYITRALLGKREKFSMKEFQASYQRHSYMYEEMELGRIEEEIISYK